MNIPVELTSVNYSEMISEVERLRRVTKRDVEVKPVECECDRDRMCGYCGGDGLFYVLVFSFCGHVVQDGPDDECFQADCVHREYVASIEREEQLEAVTK